MVDEALRRRTSVSVDRLRMKSQFRRDIGRDMAMDSTRPHSTSGRFSDLFMGHHKTHGKVAMKRPRLSKEGYTVDDVRVSALPPSVVALTSDAFEAVPTRGRYLAPTQAQACASLSRDMPH